MWFGILGPTEVRLDDGRPVAVGGPRLRGLLAMLVLDAGKAVSVEWLIDGLYGAEAPDGVTNALQAQVSRLRQALRTGDRQGTLVESHPAGYRLAVEPDDVDAHRFQRLTAVGQRALATGDHPGAAGRLGEALALWRGDRRWLTSGVCRSVGRRSSAWRSCGLPPSRTGSRRIWRWAGIVSW